MRQNALCMPDEESCGEEKRGALKRERAEAGVS